MTPHQDPAIPALPPLGRYDILRKAAEAMTQVNGGNPEIWKDWVNGFSVHTEPDDIVAIWRAAQSASRADCAAGRAAGVQGEAVPTNREDAQAGNANAIRHVAYSEGYRDGKEASRARSAGEAVAWGIFAMIDGEWALQFPTYGSEHLAKRDLARFVGGIELDVRPLYTAPQAETLAVAEGFVLVPREFVQGFGTLAHNYSLNAEAPDYFRGVERDAFASAYRRCGEDLAKLRAMLAAAPTPTASIAPRGEVTTQAQVGQIDCGTIYQIGDAVDVWVQSGTSQAHYETGFKVVGWRLGAGNYITVHKDGDLRGAFEVGSPQYRKTFAAPKAEGEAVANEDKAWNAVRAAARGGDIGLILNAAQDYAEACIANFRAAQVAQAAPLAKVDAQVAGREALEKALIAECERAMAQRDEFKRTSVSTAGHGGSHDTCFGLILRDHGVGIAAAPGAQAAVGEWQPIETAPKDGERCLYLAVLDDAGAVKEIDHAAIWGEDTERLEGHVISQGYCWLSANGMEEPTHWAYQDGAPPETQLGRWRYRGGDPETGDSGDLEWEPMSLVDRIKKHVLHLTASDFHPEWRSSVESSMLLDEAIAALTTPRPEATAVAPVAGEVKHG